MAEVSLAQAFDYTLQNDIAIGAAFGFVVYEIFKIYKSNVFGKLENVAGYLSYFATVLVFGIVVVIVVSATVARMSLDWYDAGIQAFLLPTTLRAWFKNEEIKVIVNNANGDALGSEHTILVEEIDLSSPSRVTVRKKPVYRLALFG